MSNPPTLLNRSTDIVKAMESDGRDRVDVHGEITVIRRGKREYCAARIATLGSHCPDRAFQSRAAGRFEALM